MKKIIAILLICILLITIANYLSSFKEKNFLEASNYKYDETSKVLMQCSGIKESKVIYNIDELLTYLDAFNYKRIKLNKQNLVERNPKESCFIIFMNSNDKSSYLNFFSGEYEGTQIVMINDFLYKVDGEIKFEFLKEFYVSSEGKIVD